MNRHPSQSCGSRPGRKLARWSWSAPCQSLLFALLVLLAGVRGAGAEPPAPPPVAPNVGVDEKLGQTVPASIHLVDEDGNRVELGKLVDKPTLLTLNFFRCTGLCTPLLNGLADAMKRLDRRPGTDYQVITISFDPRDDADLARAKKQNYVRQLGPGFPPGAWRFLTGDPGATRRVADAVGFRFAPVGDQYVHPGVIMVLSPTLKVTRYLYGVTFLPFDLKMALLEAAEGRPGPTINKFLAFCYSYDPSGRTYFFNITRVTAAFTLLLAAVFVAILVVRGRRHRDQAAPS
jgi:protein SCO1/2